MRSSEGKLGPNPNPVIYHLPKESKSGNTAN